VRSVEETISREGDMGRTDRIFRKLAVRKISEGGNIVLLHDILIFLERELGKIFE